ncbi:hypothetical protein TKK_0015379 [Trichogramma kaykai]
MSLTRQAVVDDHPNLSSIIVLIIPSSKDPCCSIGNMNQKEMSKSSIGDLLSADPSKCYNICGKGFVRWYHLLYRGRMDVLIASTDALLTRGLPPLFLDPCDGEDIRTFATSLFDLRKREREFLFFLYQMALLVHQRSRNGRLYVINRSTPQMFYLRCHNIQFRCFETARVNRENRDDLIEIDPHAPSCPLNPDAIEDARFKEVLRHAVETDRRPLREIYDTIALLYPEAAQRLSFAIVHNCMRRWRVDHFFQNPNTLQDMAFQLNNPDNDGLFIHRHGSTTRQVFRDADDSAHFLFFNAELLNRIIPSITVVTIDQTFTACFQIPGQRLQLVTVMCLLSNIRRLDLDDFVRMDDEARAFIRNWAALALLPVESIPTNFEAIVNDASERVVRRLQGFTEYFRRFWLQRIGAIHFSIFGVHARTNSAIATYHADLLHTLGENPPFLRFIFGLRTIQARQFRDLNAMEQGQVIWRQPRSATMFRHYELQRATLRPGDIQQVLDFENASNDALPINQGRDPEFDFAIVRDVRFRNVERLIQIALAFNLMPNRGYGRQRRRRERARPYIGQRLFAAAGHIAPIEPIEMPNLAALDLNADDNVPDRGAKDISNRFVPLVNNEKINTSTFKEGLTNLQRMVLIGGPDNGVITPWQSSQFGYYNVNETVGKMRDRDEYQNDLIGLKSLDKNKKLILHTMPGIPHFMWRKNMSIVDEFILPYLD